jgi:hypothetical protein
MELLKRKCAINGPSNETIQERSSEKEARRKREGSEKEERRKREGRVKEGRRKGEDRERKGRGKGEERERKGRRKGEGSLRKKNRKQATRLDSFTPRVVPNTSLDTGTLHCSLFTARNTILDDTFYLVIRNAAALSITSSTNSDPYTLFLFSLY